MKTTLSPTMQTVIDRMKDGECLIWWGGNNYSLLHTDAYEFTKIRKSTFKALDARGLLTMTNGDETSWEYKLTPTNGGNAR